MFPELNNLMGVDPTNPSLDECICVTESGADGTFVLHHYISLCLKSKINVCLVGLAQAFNHYSHVATKLSLNLSKCKEDGSLVFVEGLKIIGGEITNCGEVNISQNLIEFAGSNDDLKNLHKYIETSLGSLKNQTSKATLLVIDDISVLITLGIPPQQIVYFISYLRSLMKQLGGSLLVLCQKPFGALVGEDEDMELLWKQICYHSQVVLHVEGLGSGYCKDVHGQMTIIRRNVASKQSQRDKKVVQFKMSDRNVSFFAPGMSAAVLGH